MIICNRSGSSVYVSDLDRSFSPFGENIYHEVTKQELLKSVSLRNLIKTGVFEPTSFDENDVLEKGLHEAFTEVSSSKKDSLNEFKKGIIIRGQFLDYSGYAKVNRNLADSLLKARIGVRINALDAQKPRLIGKDLEKSSIYKYVNTSYGDMLIDSVVPNSDIPRGKKATILYTTVEAYTIPDSFINIFSSYDEIWVTSNFCRSVIANRISKNVHVVPGVVDNGIYTSDGDSIDFQGNAKSFKFISVFNWNYRKGPDALIKAYCKAFSKNDDVSLILLCRHKRISGPAKDVKNEVDKELSKLNRSDLPHIMRITKELDERGIASLYRSCNCFVLPSRGEGYGLPYLEASLCGLPVLGTNVSSIKDILTNENSCLVDIDRLCPVPSGSTGCYFWDEHIMADLTTDDFIKRLADSMRDIYKNYEKYVEKNKILQKETLVKASHIQCCKSVVERLENYK